MFSLQLWHRYQKWSNKTLQYRVRSHCNCSERWACHRERIGWRFVTDI